MSTKPTGTAGLTRDQAAAVPSHSRGERKSIDHHTQEWSSGTRGGGKVPADFGWFSNPKQYQEETGSSTIEEERNLEKEKYTKR